MCSDSTSPGSRVLASKVRYSLVRAPKGGCRWHLPVGARLSSSLCRRAVAGPWKLEPCGSREGRQHGEQDQRARARPALGACATRPGHAVNMLTEERLCKRYPGSALVQLSTAVCAALPEPQSSQILRAACAQPAAQSLGDARTCMCELVYGASRASWFVEKKEGSAISMSTIASFITVFSLGRAACIIS